MTLEPSRLRWTLAATLFVATLLVFRPAVSCGFINFDDPLYVQNNPILHDGLSTAGIERAFTTVQGGYWIPLTWISYQIDYHFSGLNPSGYHRTNVLLHAATAALLFLTLCRMTSAIGRALAAAALFAVHPIQVESVAWVTERKDVLSTFFLMIALWAYTGYARNPGPGRYLLLVLFFVLGLMAKPMLVTLPVVLLVLDYWPLDRSHLGLRRLLLEKLPLLLLALAAGVLTIATQRQGTAVRSLDEFSLYARLGNAVVCYVVYLRMMLWPYPLAVFYPHPGNDLPLWQLILAGSFLLGLTVAAFSLRRRAPYLLAGWLWYAITLAPVSGILQAGWQGRADRFVYVPSIGLFVAVIWGIADLVGTRIRRRSMLLATGGILAGYVVLTTIQLGHWRDSRTIWEHTAAVTEDNFVCRATLAAALMDRGCTEGAVKHLERAIALKPNHELAYYLLGLALREQRQPAEAERRLREALRISPKYVEALAALAELLAEEKRFDEAEQRANRAMELEPRSAVALASLATIRLRQGREEGLELLRTAISLDPHDPVLRLRLADELRFRNRSDP